MAVLHVQSGFNTQPPEGGWRGFQYFGSTIAVSTHSRLKAAGYAWYGAPAARDVSTHSRLKAAGFSLSEFCIISHVSTHSRLKAAGVACCTFLQFPKCFNTQPPEGGWETIVRNDGARAVSTHSRLKAAGGVMFLVM